MGAPKQYLVKRGDTASLSNVLNEMFYEEKMTLQELRFFLVYLSKINPKDPDKTEVSFSLEEYADTFGVEINEKAIDAAIKKVLRHVVCIRSDVLRADVCEEYSYCQLFSRAKLSKGIKDNKWQLTFSCHEDIKDKIFNLSTEYTRLEIWNAVNLSNFQDIRMYMLLRQYLMVGERTIDLKELKKMIGIDEKAYPDYKIFSRDVLKKCQKALKKHTDICFDFSSVGRPASAVHFNIYPNEDYELPVFLAGSEPLVIEAANRDTDEDMRATKEQIGYDNIYEDLRAGKLAGTCKTLELILTIIHTAIHATKEDYTISKTRISGQKVKEQMEQVNEAVVRYVLDNMQHTCETIRNPESYLRSALYNAVDTVSVYESSKVHAANNRKKKEVPMGAGELGEAELDAIRKLMADN